MEYELIKNIELFKSITEEDFSKLKTSVKIKKISQGYTLFRKGDEGTSFYIISSGRMKIVLPSIDGDERIVSILSKGDYFGEMALLDNELRSADAVAMEDTELYVLRKPDFLSFLQLNINALKTVLSVLSKRIRQTDTILEDLCFLKIPKRLAKKLLEFATEYGKVSGESIYIDLSITQKDIGDIIGATRESINKELKKLRDEGIIEIHDNRIKIVDLNELRKLAA